jgi:hypothetical protein
LVSLIKAYIYPLTGNPANPQPNWNPPKFISGQDLKAIFPPVLELIKGINETLLEK